MNEIQKKKVKKLFDEMFNTTLTPDRDRDREISEELNDILIDPNWSDYIFFGDDYLNDDGTIDYEKFFHKMESYSNSADYKKRKELIRLSNLLISKNFTEKNEIDIVNELNSLSPDPNWMQYLFVEPGFKNIDGTLKEKKYLKKLFEQT